MVIKIDRNACNLLKQPFGSITGNSLVRGPSIFAALLLDSHL